MKKIILLFGFLFIFSKAYSQDEYFKDMDITLSNPDLNGSIYYNNTIFVYGESGMVLQSTDKGQTWSQFCINDSMNIIKMINLNNELYGISSNNFLFKSTDNGKKWIIKSIGRDYNFYGLEVLKDKLYCLGKNKIYSIQNDLSLQIEYEFTTDTSYYEMAVVNSKIYYTAGKGKIGIYDVSNKTNEVIDLSELGLCQNCKTTRLLIPTEDKLYFYVRFDLFSLDAKSKEVKKVASAMNPNNAAIGAYKNKLFNIYTFNDTYQFNLDSLYFYTYDNINDVWERTDENKYDRYIWDLKFTALNFIDDNTIIAVGKDKLIYMSYDGGKNWKLKSSLTKYGYEQKIFPTGVGITAQGYRFSITTDGGITWLPQKQHIKQYTDKSYSHFQYSIPVILSEDIAFTLSFPYHTADTNISIFRNKLEKLYLQNYYIGVNKDLYPRIYDIFGKKYLFVNTNDPISKDDPKLYNNMYACAIDFNDTLVFNWKGGRINTTFIGCGTYKDMLYSLVKDYSDSTKVQYAILSIQDTNGVFYPRYMKREVFLDISNFSPNFYFPFPPFMIENNLCMSISDTANSFLYAYNVETKEFKQIFKGTKNELIQKSFNLNGKTYLYVLAAQGMKLIPKLYENPDFTKDPSNWTPTTTRYIIDKIYYESDSLKIVSGNDLLNNPEKSKIFYLRPKNTNAVVEKVESKSYLYISEPYPNPAENETTFKVYYPINEDLRTIKITASNLLGQIVSDEKAFSIGSINDYSAEIKWTIGQLPKGIYLINMKIGNHFASKPIIIN